MLRKKRGQTFQNSPQQKRRHSKSHRYILKNFWNAFIKSSKKFFQFSKNHKGALYEKWKNLKFILNFFCPRCSLGPPKMHFRSLLQKISTRFWMPPILLWMILKCLAPFFSNHSEMFYDENKMFWASFFGNLSQIFASL